MSRFALGLASASRATSRSTTPLGHSKIVAEAVVLP